MAAWYELREEVNDKLLETLGEEVEMQTFRTNVLSEKEPRESERSTSEEEPKESERLVKIICVGDYDGETGKSVLIGDYFGRSPRRNALLHACFYLKIMRWQKGDQQKPISIKLKLFEIAEQARFGNMLRAYFKASHGALVFWSAGDSSSLEDVSKWRSKIKKICPSIPCVLITDSTATKTQWIGEGKTFENELAFLRFCTTHGFMGHFAINSLDHESDGESVFGQAVNFLLHEIFKNEQLEFEERTWMSRIYRRIWNSIKPRKYNNYCDLSHTLSQ